MTREKAKQRYRQLTEKRKKVGTQMFSLIKEYIEKNSGIYDFVAVWRDHARGLTAGNRTIMLRMPEVFNEGFHYYLNGKFYYASNHTSDGTPLVSHPLDGEALDELCGNPEFFRIVTSQTRPEDCQHLDHEPGY